MTYDPGDEKSGTTFVAVMLKPRDEEPGTNTVSITPAAAGPPVCAGVSQDGLLVPTLPPKSICGKSRGVVITQVTLGTLEQ